MAMVASTPKTFVLVFNMAFPGPYQWTLNGAALQIMSQVQYLGLLFHSEAAFYPSFASLKQRTYGAWALSQQQCERLQCLLSVALQFCTCMVCVPPTAFYTCEVRGLCELQGTASREAEAVAKSICVSTGPRVAGQEFQVSAAKNVAMRMRGNPGMDSALQEAEKEEPENYMPMNAM